MTTPQELLDEIAKVGQQSREATRKSMDDNVGALAAATLLMTNAMTMQGLLQPPSDASAEISEESETQNPQ